MVLSSFHTHTKLCNHAEGEPKDYVLAAQKFLGTEHTCAGFGFSDHCPYPKDQNDTWPDVRMTPDQAFLYKKQVRESAKLVDFPVYLSFECEWDPYYNDWYKDFLKSEIGADYLVLGPHWVPDGTDRLYIPDVATDKKYLHKWTDNTLLAINSGLFAFLAHPDLCMARGILITDEIKSCFKAILEECERKQFPIEVNGNGLNAPKVTTPNGKKRIRYPFPDFWEMAQNYKVPVICNSDAHSLDLALKGAKEAIEYANSYGFSPITTIF